MSYSLVDDLKGQVTRLAGDISHCDSKNTTSYTQA